jgi:adenylate cyclase
VNLASRVCGEAKSGQILLTESTYRLIAKLEDVVAHRLDPIRVKGKSLPITVYEVKRRLLPDEVSVEALTA